MTHVYLDWNVFDIIEKKDSLENSIRDLYSELECMIYAKKIVCPYSNAHINDLLRGHLKNPNYIPNHLNTLIRLTSNLCLVQYWGDRSFDPPECHHYIYVCGAYAECC